MGLSKKEGKEKKILRRLGDNKKVCGHIQFINFNKETLQGKELSDTIIIGGCAVVDFNDGRFIWQTSEITHKISDTEFATKNSKYVIEDVKEVYDNLTDFVRSIS